MLAGIPERSVRARGATRIKSVIRRDETILRLGGDGGIGSLTWTADDRLLVTVLDGCGWPRDATNHYSNTRLFEMHGTPEAARFQSLAGYPDAPLWEMMPRYEAIRTKDLQRFRKSSPGYYGFGLLAVGDRIYQYLVGEQNLENDAINVAFGDIPKFNATKLIYSPDNGKTWCNQDGSTPVVRETQEQQSRANTLFFKEADGAFATAIFLQMGKGYQENRDGYVYGYSGNGVSRPNELVLFRVPKDQILRRSAYEYFARMDRGGEARWSKDINARGVMHAFPAGWSASQFIYNAPLGLYLMVGAAGHVDAYGTTTGQPSALGLWTARNAWGPWAQIHEESVWTPGGDRAAIASAPCIVPKWIARDGKSFWLVWTDWKGPSADPADPLNNPKSEQEFIRARFEWGRAHPHFGFNTQRVDLELV